ncbi:NUDIX domain-containing protein [Streptomyces sp. NBC_00371]|uniref:NUDIX domain-containing protein n=1 Tax=Streptomyces sp. NBC_00371 TaxID=2975729 RepID=UPI003FA7A657
MLPAGRPCPATSRAARWSSTTIGASYASGIRLLAPGGHVESEDRTLPAAALCELAEEAGIPPGALCLTPRYLGAPIDSDVHDIEASQANGEPGTGISTSATSRRRGDAGCDFAGAGGVWCPPVGIV